MVHLDRSKTVRQAGADWIEEAVLRGELRPGDEIPQLRLAKRLGLSQASLREALQELEHRGLVVRSGRTRRVIALSEDELANNYQVRGVLEPLACKLAAYRWTQDLTRQLRGCIEKMAETAAARRYREHLNADVEFHRIIWRNQPNRLLENELERVCRPVWTYDLVVRSPDAHLDFEKSLRQHRMILSVLASRDGRRAERIVSRLIHVFFQQDLHDFWEVESERADEGDGAASTTTDGQSKA